MVAQPRVYRTYVLAKGGTDSGTVPWRSRPPAALRYTAARQKRRSGSQQQSRIEQRRIAKGISRKSRRAKSRASPERERESRDGNDSPQSTGEAADEAAIAPSEPEQHNDTEDFDTVLRILNEAFEGQVRLPIRTRTQQRPKKTVELPWDQAHKNAL